MTSKTNLDYVKNEFLFVEKYRPQTVADCVLTKELTTTFQEIVNSGQLPNMIFSGTAGVGKTTIARALCKTLDLDWILINGSEESGIDTLRTKIKQFASSVSLRSGSSKVVILDEADYLNPQSTQPALRGFIEEFSNNCRFILTCNFKNRIIEPLHSRCTVIDFSVTKKNLPSLASAFLNRLTKILDNENIKYDQKVLVELIIKHAPDWRRVLNECQRYSVSGVIDVGILTTLKDESIASLMTVLKNKDFKGMRKWVVDHVDIETTAIFRRVYDSMADYLKPASIPGVILLLAEYQYKAAFVADQEINIVACLTEIMASAEWK
jgi:DNA polymerase III delta prime subunit